MIENHGSCPPGHVWHWGYELGIYGKKRGNMRIEIDGKSGFGSKEGKGYGKEVMDCK